MIKDEYSEIRQSRHYSFPLLIVTLLFVVGLVAIIFFQPRLTGFVTLANVNGTFSEDFESTNLTNWVLGGKGSPWTISNINPRSSTYHTRAAGTQQESTIETTIDTKKYQNITFSFYYSTFGLDPGEYFRTEWWNGTNWTMVLDVTGTRSYTFSNSSLPFSASNNQNFKIRFSCRSNAADELCDIDDIVIAGQTDTTPPSVIINQPTNITYNTTTDLPLQFSVNDNLELSSCWYSLDNSANTTIAACANTIFNVSAPGGRSITLYANDTSGNLNWSSMSFSTLYNTSLMINESKNTVEIHDALNIFAAYSYVNGSPITNATCIAYTNHEHHIHYFLEGEENHPINHEVIAGNMTTRTDFSDIPLGMSNYSHVLKYHKEGSPAGNLLIYLRCDGNYTIDNNFLIGNLTAAQAPVEHNITWTFVYFDSSRLTSSNCSVILASPGSISMNNTNAYHILWSNASAGRTYLSTNSGATWSLQTYENIVMLGNQMANHIMIYNSTNVRYELHDARYFSVGTKPYNVTCSKQDHVTRISSRNITVLDNVAPFVQVTTISPNPARFQIDNVSIEWVADDFTLQSKRVDMSYPNGTLFLQSLLSPVTLTTSQLVAVGNYTISVWANDSQSVNSSISAILTVHFYLPTTNFDGSTTDLTNIATRANITGLTLEKSTKGKIIWNTPLEITRNLDFDNYVNISSNFIRINSSALPELNKSATITLNGITFADPKVQYDPEDDGTFVDCSSNICTEISYSSGNFIFNVTGFTSYQAAESYAAPSPSSGGGGGGGLPSCSENWNCTAWSNCINGTQSRTCNDINKCGTTLNKPNLTQACTMPLPKAEPQQMCKENWVCSDWGACTNDSLQFRNCVDKNNCGTNDQKPKEVQSCEFKEQKPESIPESKPALILPTGQASPTAPTIITAQRIPNPIFAMLTILLLTTLAAIIILSKTKLFAKFRKAILAVHIMFVALILVSLLFTFIEIEKLQVTINIITDIAIQSKAIVGIIVGITSFAIYLIILKFREHTKKKNVNQHPIQEHKRLEHEAVKVENTKDNLISHTLHKGYRKNIHRVKVDLHHINLFRKPFCLPPLKRVGKAKVSRRKTKGKTNKRMYNVKERN